MIDLFMRFVGLKYTEVNDPWGSAMRMAYDLALGVAFMEQPEGEQ